MAQVCLDRAVHTELRELCEQIVAAPSEEVETLQTWLEECYGVSSIIEAQSAEIAQL